jgi:hypothetical protein
MRDDFSPNVKLLLAKRVNFICSNPDCQRTTTGPSSDPRKSINIGVASHITAAAPGGPRYDATLSQEERKSPENGIWLCQKCAKLVDSDPQRYSQEILRKWKLNAEARTLEQIQGTYLPSGGIGRQISLVVIANQLDQLASQMSGEIEQHIELMREAWREGKRDEAVKWVRDLQENEIKWQIISPEVKAKILRFEASLELDIRGDVNRSKQLADEAKDLAPSDAQSRLRALIVYKDTGPEAAIELLDGEEDVDSVNLKAALLLEMGCVEKCQAILNSPDVELKANAETFRIRALAYFVTKDLGRGRLQIRKALEIRPRWESIQFTDAVINYFSALSPASLPGHILSWPEPVDRALVKGDDESLTRLREAEKVFKALAEKPSKKNDERQSLESWRLACLTNDPERQVEAVDYCRAILKTNRTHYRAIAWALANFDIDLKTSEKALNKLIKRHMAEIPHILALVGYYLSSRKAKKALKLLNDTKSMFKEQKADMLWKFWYAQALVIDENAEAALMIIDSSGTIDGLRQVRTIALHVLAKKSGSWQQLVEHLERSLEESKEMTFLLQVCQLMAQRQNWHYVADRAKRLVEEIGTGEALRLAAIASYNAKRFDLCLRLLDDHQDLFKQHKLPTELRRIRALSQQALGTLPVAIVEAEALARDEPTTENLLILGQLYFSKGDIKGLAILSRQLIDRTDLSAEYSLQIARLIHREDPQLATSLWRKAVSQDLPDSFVGEAVATGYQLGLDEEMRSLFARMAELGAKGRGGIQMGRIEDLKLLVTRQREHGMKLDEFYRNASIPIHLIAEQANLPLVNLYHRFLAENESAPDPRRQFFLLARHGGRTLIQKFPKSPLNWRLNIDVTAFLMAAHLDILDLVEKVFKPIHMPADLIPALIAMRDKVTPPQPSRLRAFQQIIDLADRGSLVAIKPDLQDTYENTQLIEEMGEDWVVLFEKGRGEGGYLVDFLPLRKKDLNGSPSTLPNDADKYLVNCRAIVEALWQEGPLSAEQYTTGLAALGNEGKKDPSSQIPRQGSSLFCRGNIPEVFAGANLLQIVCDRFKVRIEGSELDRVRAELKVYDERRTLSDWTGGLIDRIRRGIDNGAYEIIPSLIEEEQKSDETPSVGPEYKCLLALLGFQAREGDVMWIDDRSLNSFLRRDTVPIIGINEILQALVSANVLSIPSYYSKISRLRASNVRFIPVQKDEILYYLRQAKVENNSVTETGELAIFRRYVAACLLSGALLQHPPMPKGAPNENGEIAFIVSLGRAVMDALVELWTDTDNEDIREARAEWILSSLYIDHLGLFNVVGLQRSEKDERYMAAITLGGLISQTISLRSTSLGGEPSPRRKFFQWLFNRILRKRFEADPLLVASIADILKKTIFSSSDEVLKKEPKGMVIRVLQLFYKDLPEDLKRELARDSDFMAAIGIKFMTTVTISNWNFDPEDFWKAASEAINGRESNIRPIESDIGLTFQPLEESAERGVFCVIEPVTGKRNIVKNEELELLLESPVERESVLRRNRHWFDCPSETLEKVIAEIASMEDPRRRIDAIEAWRKSSAASYYQRLCEKLEERKPLKYSDLLPPDPEGLLRHLRLTSNTGRGEEFLQALDTATANLLREESLMTAIDRVAGLPVPLPKSLVHALADLSSNDRYGLIKRLFRNAGSPLSKIHLVFILIQFGPEKRYLRLARRVIKSLLSDVGSEEFEAFWVILNWTNNEFCNLSQIQHWPAHIRLAVVWFHAHRLFATFTSLGAPLAMLKEDFRHTPQRIPVEFFTRNIDYWFDIAHPRHINKVKLFLSGLSYSLSEKAKEILNEGLRSLIEGIAFPEKDAQRLPALDLLRDSTLARNSLSTFLGGDYQENLRFLINAEGQDESTRSSFQTVVENAINKLTLAKEDFSAWALLHAVLGDLPPYQAISEPLRAILRDTDYGSLFEKDIICGALALQVASLQAINLPNQDLCNHLKDQIIRISKFLANQQTAKGASSSREEAFTNPIESGLFLLEPALNVSLAGKPPQGSIAEFVALLTQIVDVWPTVVSIYKSSIQRLCEELPVSLAGQFWPLLVRLRAE